MENNLPIYDFYFDATLMKGVTGISLVSSPAIDIEAIQFNEDKIEVQEWKLASEDKRILVSPVLIPNKLIPRKNIQGGPAYVRASAEVIEMALENYMTNGYQNNSKLQHNEDIQGVTFFQHWIVEDPNNDKANALGFKDLPKGTWMAYAKLSEELWNDYVKTGEVKGFSIDAMLGVQLSNNNDIKLNKEENMDKDVIKQIVLEAMQEFKLAEQPIKTTVESVKMKFDIMVDGTAMYYADSFDMGSIVYNMDDSIAASVEFEYEGNSYETDETGAINSIEPIEVEKTEVEMEDITPSDVKPADVAPSTDVVSADWQAKLDEKDAKIAELEAQINKMEADLVKSKEEQVMLSKETPASSGIKNVPVGVKFEDMTPLEQYRELKRRG